MPEKGKNSPLEAKGNINMNLLLWGGMGSAHPKDNETPERLRQEAGQSHPQHGVNLT